MPEFFLELFSEEIPARMQRDAALMLLQRVRGANLEMEEVELFYGPRRIALSAVVADSQPGRMAEERGPREGAPDIAINGFLKKHNAAKADLVLEGGYYVLRKMLSPVSARDILRTNLPGLLEYLGWPKTMRWGQSGNFNWVRPLRRIVCLLDGEVIPFTLGPITASNFTEGHRIQAPGPIEVSSADDWKTKLKSAFVIADQRERQLEIETGLDVVTYINGLTRVNDSELLEEVTGLVEWPVALIGKIDDDFMSLPSEVRELSMKVNQRYFALRDSSGKSAPYFAFIANIKARDQGAAIIAGNERVLRARLSDARHFWDHDLKTPLDELLPKLDKITFHAKIGTQGDRVKRIAALAYKIAKMLDADDETAKQAEWAGLLSKADLVTGMVGEFPELQGIMGGYYAERNPRGWDGVIVGPAIATHYQPKGPSDAVPTDAVAVSVALADKLDTLIQFFRINEKPTGSGDPYALRRAALGVIRIILENKLSLKLRNIIEEEKLYLFIIERLRVMLKGAGRRFDILDAVLTNNRDDDLMRLMGRVSAIAQFIETSEGTNLIVAYRRASNILRIENEKDGPHYPFKVHREMETPEEDALQEQLDVVEREAIEDFENANFGRALSALAKLRTAVDNFFDAVKINVEWPKTRTDRLQLLARLKDIVDQIADFSKIEG